MGEAARRRKRGVTTPLATVAQFIRTAAPFLYRYRPPNLVFLEDVIARHELYFANPTEFEDSEDARPKLIAPAVDKMRRYIKDEFRQAHMTDHPLIKAQDELRMARMFDSANAAQLAAALTPVIHGEMERHRILSMTLRPNNQYLWQKYAADHTGCCFEFLNLFERHLRTRTPAVVGLVQYGDSGTIDVSHHESITGSFLFQKRMDFVNEEEVRVMLFPRGQLARNAFDPVLLRRVILGRNMAADVRQTIHGWCQARESRLEVVEEQG